MPNPILFVKRHIASYWSELRNAPAAQYVARAVAPMQMPEGVEPTKPEKALVASAGWNHRPVSLTWSESEADLLEATTVTKAAPQPKKGGVFDFVTNLAGSRYVFLCILGLLGLWSVLGAVYGPTDTWQVILQDTSSIQCYMSDTLLMRQQQNSTRSLLNTICSMISRSESCERMLKKLSPRQLAKIKRGQLKSRLDIGVALRTKENFFDKIANFVSAALGSLIAIGIYWMGITVWLFLGIPYSFSNTWQLWVNTATAIELTITTMFLQSVRRQHEEYLGKCLEKIDRVDRELEVELRTMTGDVEPNPVVETTPIILNRIEKAIDVYAFIIGSSTGVFISTVVFIIWLSVGPGLGFDDNWFLIIGTYTGLVGFVDGFVLRNVHHRETLMADGHFERLLAADFRLFYALDLPLPDRNRRCTKGLDGNPDSTTGPSAPASPDARRPPRHSAASLAGGWGRRPRSVASRLGRRLSDGLGRVCSRAGASCAAVAVVAGLLVTATALGWTETAQLLCNTPTMIVEGFLLLVLIEAHNGADARRRGAFKDVLIRRTALWGRVAGAGGGAGVEKEWDEKEWDGHDDDGVDKKREGGRLDGMGVQQVEEERLTRAQQLVMDAHRLSRVEEFDESEEEDDLYDEKMVARAWLAQAAMAEQELRR